MKKVLALLVIIIVVYFGYQVYLKNTNNDKENVNSNIMDNYVLDENYIFSMKFEEVGVSNITTKIYYIYNNEKAVLETIVTEKSDNSIKEHKYLDVSITDDSFDVNKAVTMIEEEYLGQYSSAHRFIFYIKAKNREYRLLKTDDITKKLLDMFDEEAK